MAVRSLIVALEARTQAFETALNRTERKVADFERSVAKVQRVLGFAATAGGLYIATKKLFDLGSAVEETRNKFETTFGAATESVTRFGREFAGVAGLSQRTFQELAGTTGAIAQGLGFAEQASAAFAQQVLKLSADLASFNNLETADVAQRITTALTGERESMKRLGIVVTEAEVQQKAFANTGKTVAATLTQQEKATATLEIITQKAGKAVGDLARTSDSAANRAKQLKAEFQTIAETFAAQMLPALERMLPLFARLASAVGWWVQQLGLAALQLRELAKPGSIQHAADLASLGGLGGSALTGRRRQEIGRQTDLAVMLDVMQSGQFNMSNSNLSHWRRLMGEAAIDTKAVRVELERSAAIIARLDALIAAQPSPLAVPGSTGGGRRAGAIGPLGAASIRGGGAGLRFNYLEHVEQNAPGMAYSEIAAASNAFADAATVTIAAFGSMAQAAVYGSANMASAIVGAMTQIGQAIVQLNAARLGAAAGPIGALIGAVGGFFTGLFGGGDKPQPVIIRDVSDRAADKLERRRTGPDRVQIYVVDQRGSVRSIVEQLNRQTQRDAIPRLAGV